MKRDVLTTLPYDWRFLLIIVVIFLAFYVLVHYLIFLQFSAPDFNGSAASFFKQCGASLA